MSLQHTQRSPWGPPHWPPNYAGQAYAPGSLPAPQAGGYAPPPGYGGHGHHHAAPSTPGMPHPHPTGHVPVYPVQQVGYAEFPEPTPSFSETAPHPASRAYTFVEDEQREPTPPLFKPIVDKTLITPPSVKDTGTLPPQAPATDRPRESEPPPQSTTSPNTPLPDSSGRPEPSPDPPPVEVTPRAAQLDLDALDPDGTLRADLTQRVAPVRPFVEDGKTTQLSLTSLAHPFALTLEQYAALCAERDRCGPDAERRRKIHKRYDIGDERARNLVDRLFKLRFEDDPELEAHWRACYERFAARLRERDAEPVDG